MPRSHPRDLKLEQFWRTTLTKWSKSGLNIRDFCRKLRLTEPSFYSWRREITSRDGTPIAKPAHHTKSTAATRRNSTSSRTTRSASRRTPKPTSPSFVALRVVPDTPLELVLRSGQVLRIPPGYDANHLRTVVAALETQPC